MVYNTADRHIAAVSALLDALFPALDQEATAAREAGNEAQAIFLETSGAKDPAVALLVLEAISELPPETQRGLTLILELLQWRMGTLLLGGTAALSSSPPFLQPFTQLSLSARTSILQAWATSSIPKLLEAFKGIKALFMSTLFSYTDAKGANPLWPAIQYVGPDAQRPAHPCEDKCRSEQMLCTATIDLNDYTDPASLQQALASLPHTPAEEVKACGGAVQGVCDVVVVGSGAGGGVAAALLAQAGAKVIIVEKGNYTRAADLSLLERDAFQGMYEGGGLATTDNAGINILAGATLGGGTRINWSASFPTPAHVRQEWAEEHGLSAFQSSEYDAALDAVITRLGVTVGILEHSKANAKLKEGLERLGLHSSEIPRNSSRGHACGHCSFGCAHGDKQDATATFLADAVQAGAGIITGAFAEKINLAKAPQGGDRPQIVQGVAIRCQRPPAVDSKGTDVDVSDLRLHLRCKYVISSAGALHTPTLLQRSGITVGGQVGKHLRMHPATVVTAKFPEEDGPILGWDGAIMSTFSSEAADWEQSGYGPLLATPSAHPGLTAASFPWPDGAEYKMKTLTFPFTAGALVYVRDKDSGTVYLGSDNMPRISYWPSKHDRASMMKGMVLGLRALVAAGAESVMVLYTSRRATFRPARSSTTGSLMNTSEFEQYLSQVQLQGIDLNAMAVLTAHQMGSARMGVAKETSAVDGNGECWDVRNLYVADAALMPTSTGVNPMITIEATVWMLMSRLALKYCAELTPL